MQGGQTRWKWEGEGGSRVDEVVEGRKGSQVEKERKEEGADTGHINKRTAKCHASCGPGFNKCPLEGCPESYMGLRDYLV